MIKALLQGKGLGHPVHPALVHFPIGLLILTLLLDLIGVFLADDLITQAATYSLAGAVGMGVIAAAPGFVDYLDIRADHPAKKVAATHMFLNLSVLILSIISLWLRISAADRTVTAILPLLFSAAAVGIVMYSGYLGGGMVYNDGIGVGRHRRYTDTPSDTISAQNGSEYVTIALLSQLEDASTLRAEINGHVLTVARVGNSVYAFQEFCTHRFGPLSEGKLFEYDIMCPWHRSCFDVRTGKVTDGPAKIDLNTYKARVENGEIQIRIPLD